MGKTYYEVLDVGFGALVEEIKQAYKLKLLSTHPDKQGVHKNESGVSIDLIKEAYLTLSLPEKAKKYHEELQETFKKQGFSISGEGLDVYTLELFTTWEENEQLWWGRDCPRCTVENGMQLSEEDLENGTPDGTGGYQILVSCTSCSLWIIATYEEAEEI